MVLWEGHVIDAIQSCRRRRKVIFPAGSPINSTCGSSTPGFFIQKSGFHPKLLTLKSYLKGTKLSGLGY